MHEVRRVYLVLLSPGRLPPFAGRCPTSITTRLTSGVTTISVREAVGRMIITTAGSLEDKRADRISCAHGRRLRCSHAFKLPFSDLP